MHQCRTARWQQVREPVGHAADEGVEFGSGGELAEAGAVEGGAVGPERRVDPAITDPRRTASPGFEGSPVQGCQRTAECLFVFGAA